MSRKLTADRGLLPIPGVSALLVSIAAISNRKQNPSKEAVRPLQRVGTLKGTPSRKC